MNAVDHKLTSIDIISQFRNAMANAGLAPPDEIIADGKMHSFATNGRQSDDAGRYILHLDGIAAGWFCDHRTGINQFWHVSVDHTLTAQEQAAYQAKIANMRKKRDTDDKKRHAVAAAKSINVWKHAAPAKEDHPYFARKQVAPTATLREMTATDTADLLGYKPKSKGEQLQGRLIVVPVKIGHGISTLELIDEDGRKSAVAGGAKAGGYWAPCPLPHGDGEGLVLGIGEGVATVLSVLHAAAIVVVAALSSGNLIAVGQEMRARYPKARLLLLGDLGNGLAQAEQAARAVGGFLALPSFTPERIDGDFNDMLVALGTDAVRQAVASAIPPSDDLPPAFLDVPDYGSVNPTIEPIRATDLILEPVESLWDGQPAASKPHFLDRTIAGNPGLAEGIDASGAIGGLPTVPMFPNGDA
jgi:phage/plasmid primase-like uncharacterized protein